MTQTLRHLRDLYASTNDPWNFANSRYEQSRFAATRRALGRPCYRAALELGCGNGALARHLAPLCQSYTGIDAIDRAVVAARVAVPEARFITATYPCRLPRTDYDLVILSEILYFLTPAQIRHLADDLHRCAAGAEVICVTWAGDTEQELQGAEALAVLRDALWPDTCLSSVLDTGEFRIDRALMAGAGA